MKNALLILCCLMLLLTACGKRGALDAPPDSDPKYPRTYPQR
jgi:predicted small lipoprotein YifL